MSKDYFRNTIRALEELSRTTTYTMEILPDQDGYIDKECPNEGCLSQFKVNDEDWGNLFSDEAVYCPFCGHSAPADKWWTTEQVEQAKRQAVRSVEAKIGNALSRDAREFNRSQPRNSFIKMSMKYKGPTHFVNVPAEALAEMEQKIQCDNCGARYAVIGSAFFCPCCGKNSARLTFTNTIEKVRAKVRNIDAIRELISQTSKDEAARTCTSLLESCVPDLVVAFQRVCECVYPQLPGAGSLRRNVFQRLDDGSALWRNLVGQGYEDWIDSSEMRSLRICFQQRHLFQHQDGIVDQDYIDKSGDTTYQIGQHIIVKKEDVLMYTDIVEKIGNHVLGLLGGTTHE